MELRILLSELFAHADGSIVWTFLNPEFDEAGRRQIYRMQRVPMERYVAWDVSVPSSTP